MTSHPFQANRRFVLGALRAARRAATVTALVEIDVTDSWQRTKDEDISMTAFVIACVGRAVAIHPEVHAYRDFSGRLVTHRHVDVAAMLDVMTDSGRFPLAYPLRDTDSRSVKDISHEFRTITAAPELGATGRWLMRWGGVVSRLPGFVSLMYYLMARSRLLRSKSGTVAVSAVGMMLGGNGFGIAIPSMTLSVVIGGISEKPWVVDHQVMVRQVMDLTVQVDHRVVDGAPAAQFGATLRRLLEHPNLIEW